MAQAKFIPGEGQMISGSVPAAIETAHLTFGAATTADVVVGDTAVYTLWTVSRPIMVYGLWTQTETAWTTSVTGTIGDSTTADLFIADTTMAIASTGAVLIASTASLPIVYSAAQDILLDVNGATAAAGLTHVYLKYAVLED